ncbi:hypothetical protein PhCBS80983_g00614 [Powellomyces hirtus]|uniref:DUF1206 domain-containing protein n=1 Tax=Powellomyces hirtus TaxID=109895 RepID=A0A507EE74_9FUNG|nr:hypothetical protein PhCBS80983_g00614 [Powellomyces hirtus]
MPDTTTEKADENQTHIQSAAHSSPSITSVNAAAAPDIIIPVHVPDDLPLASAAALSRGHRHNNPLYAFLHPHGVHSKFRRLEGRIGRIGFGAKGVIYGMVGGMTCASANRLNGASWNESPQGAFILLGGFDASGTMLVIMLLCLSCYIIWRIWEAWTMQGADAALSDGKNFFSYRFSPAVSAGVYMAYAFYILRILIVKNVKGESSGCYPNCWRSSVAGRAGLVLFGIAFTIACLTQLQNAFTKKWHYEIKWERCRFKAEEWMILFTGHIGFLGRACSFMFIAALMFKALGKDEVKQGGNIFANGLNQLLDADLGGVIAMMAIGLMLTFYGFYCVTLMHYRHFPTPPPSGVPRYTPR